MNFYNNKFYIRVIILVSFFVAFFLSVDCIAQCNNIQPEKEDIEEYGDPTNLGLIKTTHRLLKRYMDLYGCPIKKPKKIIEIVCISKDNAERNYSVESGKNIQSVLIIVRGWEYTFNKDKNLRLMTGQGNAKGVVLKQTVNPVDYWVGKEMLGVKIKDRFGNW